MIYKKAITKPKDSFVFWAGGDPHQAREEYAQLETPYFRSMELPLSQIKNKRWDAGLIVGDIWNDAQHTDEYGAKFIDQVTNGLKGGNHKREDIYITGGNHDYSTSSESWGINGLFQRYADPMGINPIYSLIDNSKRDFTITGTYSAYSITKGNLLIVFLTDRNDGAGDMGQNITTGTYNQRQRYGGGMTSFEWQFLHDSVLKNPDKTIVVCFHHAIWETILCSGYREFQRYGDFPDNSSDEQNYNGAFAYIDNALQVGKRGRIEHFLKGIEGNITMWLSGHVHARYNYVHEGRTRYNNKFGIHHQNVCAMNRNLINTNHIGLLTAQSFFFNFIDDKIISDLYIHSDKAGVIPQGILASERREIQAPYYYTNNFVPETISNPVNSVTNLSIYNSDLFELKLTWNNENTGVLIVRRESIDPTATPIDGTTYYRGTAIGDGVVVFQGTVNEFTDNSLASSTNYHYKLFTYNAGGNSIKYSPTSTSINETTL